MVYKKYIERNGKLYGPYIYHSRRVNGKVVSEYQGTGKKTNYKKFIFIFLGVLIFLGIGYGVISNQTNLTGNVVVNLDANYQENESRLLQGIMNFSLSEGEFIPATSKISFETSDGNYAEYILKDLLDEEPAEGIFYIEGETLTGTGFGYGIPGEKVVFHLVNFSLEISSADGTSEILYGEVSAEMPFTYVLEQNQTAEILSSSQEVFMTMEENAVKVTTNYSETEQGYGEEFIGEEQKNFYINLSELNISVEGNVEVKFFYGDYEIENFGNLVEISGEVAETEENSPDENVTVLEEDSEESAEVQKVSPLTEDEKQILIDEFGSAVVETKVTSFRDRVIVKYIYGGMWIENSYDADLAQQELEEQMETDRIKWLRDILNSLLTEESTEEVLEGFEGNYSI